MALTGKEYFAPAPLTQAEFALEQTSSGRYHRRIEPSWCNNTGIIFGGYSAALSFAAAARASSFSTICSTHTAFLAAIQPGAIEFEVTVLRTGRAIAVLRVSGFQQDRLVLTTQILLRPPPPPSAFGASLFPESARDISWVRQQCVFYRWMESRGVDYPDGIGGFSDGRHAIDVWERPLGGQLPGGLATQLFDVLVADAHLADCHLRGEECDPDFVVSLDLGIQWTYIAHPAGWRRIQASSAAAATKSVACSGAIFDAYGTLCATVSQQTLDRR